MCSLNKQRAELLNDHSLFKVRAEQTWGCCTARTDKDSLPHALGHPRAVGNILCCWEILTAGRSFSLQSLGVTCWAWHSPGLLCWYQGSQNDAFGISLWPHPRRVFPLSFWAVIPKLAVLAIAADQQNAREESRN